MMNERIKNVVGDFIEDLLREPMTTAEQTRFTGIMERMLASDSPADQWLSSSIMMQICDKAEAEYQAEEEGRTWSVYALGKVGETKCFYLGISQDVQARYKAHMDAARSLGKQVQCSVALRIRAELEPKGPGVWVETWLSGLTKAMAQSLEATLIAELVRGGVALENQELRGKHGPPNRYPHGTSEYTVARRERSRKYNRDRRANEPEYVAAEREAKRRKYSTPEGRTRELASGALQRLKKGALVTPRGIEVITSAGPDFIDKARAILAARGEVWPME